MEAVLASPSRWAPTSEQLHLLAELLDGGVPLLDALRTLGDMAVERPTRSAFVHLASCVHGGVPLAVGLAALRVPPHVHMLLDSGERIGGLPAALRSAAELTARLEALRTEVRRAVVYPGVILAIGMVILTIIAVVVVPPLERSFADLGGELPRATRFVLAASRPFSSPLTLVVLVLAGLMVTVLRRASSPMGAAWSRRPRADGRSRMAAPWPLLEVVRDHLPLSGRLRRDLRLAVIAHVVATSTRGGVPLDVALRHVADGLPAGRTQQALEASADALVQGRDPFEDDALGRILDAGERELLRVGGRNGLVAEQWARVAGRRDRALETQVRRVSVVIEPVIVALIGGVVGGAVLALYLPTFRVLDLL